MKAFTATLPLLLLALGSGSANANATTNATAIATAPSGSDDQASRSRDGGRRSREGGGEWQQGVGGLGWAGRVSSLGGSLLPSAFSHALFCRISPLTFPPPLGFGQVKAS